MTSSLIDQIAAAPPEPERSIDDVFADAVIEETTPRTTPRPRGRPRKPKFDDDGNPIEPTPRQPRQPSNAKLSEDLLETTVSLASDISAVAPTVAGVLIARAEKTVDGLLALSAGHKRTTAALRKVASASKVTELLSTALLIVVAAMVDFGRLPSDSPILDRIGYTELTRDDKGKPVRDEQGKFVKDKKTIRDIYNVMHPDEAMGNVQYIESSFESESWIPPAPMGKAAYVTPMNMMAGTPPWERPEWK